VGAEPSSEAVETVKHQFLRGAHSDFFISAGAIVIHKRLSAIRLQQAVDRRKTASACILYLMRRCPSAPDGIFTP
jgi:hypothetical protein